MAWFFVDHEIGFDHKAYPIFDPCHFILDRLYNRWRKRSINIQDKMLYFSTTEWIDLDN